MAADNHHTDTIAAIATASGKGGVGVVRISGPRVKEIAAGILSHPGASINKPRYAQFCYFQDKTEKPIDEGLALYFQQPNSFTGEDVLELQGHGGTMVLSLVLQRAIELGARLARPGEFSERAFLNDKIDLAQAEAIADLIDSASEQAARCAVRSLQGTFSRQIKQLIESLINLRIFVEAAIDFPEEEIDFLKNERLLTDLNTLTDNLKSVCQQARQGAILKDGMEVVIAGRPNAGKSSLLNALSGRDSAIVTDLAGTTRDVLREYIDIDGMPIHLIDTAGLRESDNPVEQEGIRRAWAEIAKADRVLLVIDGSQTKEREPLKLWPEFIEKLPDTKRVTVVVNKIDLFDYTLAESNQHINTSETPLIHLSAKQDTGLDTLKTHLKDIMGYSSNSENGFIARQRHLDALNTASEALARGMIQLTQYNAGELLAEELRYAQDSLSEITGEFTSDDLLGRIFSSFCIGK